jgi:hypothetical protein
MFGIKIAVMCNDPAIVAASLAQLLKVEFEERDSSYWGRYWLYETKLPVRIIRAYLNQDPLFMHGDPPEDRYFETAFPRHRVLVGVEGAKGDEPWGRQVADLLRAAYADSQLVDSPD